MSEEAKKYALEALLKGAYDIYSEELPEDEAADRALALALRYVDARLPSLGRLLIRGEAPNPSESLAAEFDAVVRRHFPAGAGDAGTLRRLGDLSRDAASDAERVRANSSQPPELVRDVRELIRAAKRTGRPKPVKVLATERQVTRYLRTARERSSEWASEPADGEMTVLGLPLVKPDGSTWTLAEARELLEREESDPAAGERARVACAAWERLHARVRELLADLLSLERREIAGRLEELLERYDPGS